jgi:hypothetical protein
MRARRPGLGPALVLVVFGLAAACGGSPTTGASTSTQGSAGTPSTLHPPPAVTLSEADNGRTAAVGRGAEVTVVLHSTYWSLSPLSSGGAVEMLGLLVVAPQAQGCVPGQGCGTVTGHYRALSSGRSRLAAHRIICGEARACAPDQRDWQVTVTVSP